MTTIILLCVFGILAILAELILPGGILGVAGAVCLFVAVGMIFTQYGAAAGAIALVVLLILGIATLNFWMRMFHKLPLTKDLILNDSVGKDEKLSSQQTMVGKTGVTVTDLMPSGHALIEGEKYAVMTEAEAIEKGAQIKITAVRGPSMIASPLEK